MRRTLLPLVAGVLLAGCVSTPSVPVPAGATPDPAALAQWHAEGRLAVAADGNGGSGSFTWQQQAARTELAVRGPLGAGALQVVVDGDVLSIADADGRRLDAEAARQGLRERLGADLPLAELRYWILGSAAPGSTAKVEDHAATPWRVIEQAGWRVQYDGYRTSAGWRVPERLTATSPGLRIRVIVDQWNLPPAGAAK